MRTFRCFSYATTILRTTLLSGNSEELGRCIAVEQYSGFDGVNAAGQSLGEVISMLEPENVFVCGIATEFCVKNTCEDLKRAGFNVVLLSDCLAYVDAAGHKKALEEMSSEGIHIRS